MLDNILKGFTALNTITGVEVNCASDGQLMLHACKIAIEKKQLSFQEKKTQLKGIAHFAKTHTGTPIVLCITGKGIITKKIAAVPQLNQQIINQVLPNANPEHFYFQHFTSGEHSFISAIRRADADAIIAQFSEKDIQVLSLSLSCFVLDAILPQLGTGVTDLNLSGYTISFNEKNNWVDVYNQPALTEHHKMKIDVETLDSRLVLAYASAFQLLVNGMELIEADMPEVREARMQNAEKAKIKGIGVAVLIGLFILLLANFLMFTYYSGKVISLSAKSTLTATEVDRSQKEEADIDTKTNLIRSVGWTGGLRYTYITDQLLAGMPRQISLREFAINPINEQESRNKHIEVFDKASVKVTGTCLDASALNNWIFIIKTKSWVKDCKIIDYNIEQESQRGLFTINIQLKDQDE